jgi:hypothetical protein
VVDHLGQQKVQPWSNIVLIEGPALTAQGKTRPFLSYYGPVAHTWMVKNTANNVEHLALL